MRPIHVLAGTASAAALVASGVLIAGPVNPPAGAIAPTYKTLGEVEPRIPVQTLPGNATATYVISQPGSYYLTGNIAAASSKDGVLIQASGVTLDLKGFTIASQGGSTGVGVRSTSDSTTIRNGVVRDFPAGGIDLSTSVAGLHRVSDLIALTNGQFNIKVGVRSHIEDCKSYGSTGFVLGNATTVDRCRAYSGNRGFEVGASCVLTDCLANGQFGIDPYGYGFYDAGFGNTYTNCVASFNRWTGFYALSRAEFINCKSISNEAYGFDIADRGVLLDCVAEGNTGAGVHASGGAKVRDCTVLGGLSHGIHVEGTGTLVEGCAVSRCADGIRVDGTLNRVVRSSCSANTTNWRIATGNYCYVIWGAATSAAFSGNNGGTAVPSSDPTANYSY